MNQWAFSASGVEGSGVMQGSIRISMAQISW
jgi:hypothetical protein